MTDRGYLYIATGAAFVAEARNSAASLRRMHPDAHITLVTDKEVEPGDFDSVSVVEIGTEHESQWKEGTLFKVRALQASPYDRTFFVDTDTYFCDRCDELFDLLEYYDLLLCHAPGDTAPVYGGNTPLDGYYPYNTGVLVYRRCQVMHDLFEKWHEAYRDRLDDYPHDQPAFMEALLHLPVKLYVLQPNYNFRTPYVVAFVAKKVKIIHGRPKDFEAVSRTLNRRIEQRAWIPQKQGMIYQELPVVQRIKDWVYDVTPAPMRALHRRLRSVRAGTPE